MYSKSKRELITYYSQADLRQHEKGHELKAAHKIKQILHLTAIKEDDVILEIGCAKGEILYHIIKRARCGIGIDIAQNILRRARKSEKISYVQADAEHIPFDDDAFSKILCLDLLEHVHNPEQVLLEMKRVLKEHGEIIIAVPTTGFLASLLTGYFHEGHLRYYTAAIITEDLNKAGLLVKDLKLVNSVPFSTFLACYKPIFRVAGLLVNGIQKGCTPGLVASLYAVSRAQERITRRDPMRAVEGALKITEVIFKLSKRHKAFFIFRLLLVPLFSHIFGDAYLHQHIELFEEYIKDDLLSFVGSTEHKRVLDVGCGAGVLTRVTKGIGIDIIKYPQWSGIFFMVGDAQQLPFKRASFDLVILSNLLEHTDDVKKVISEAKRVSSDLIYVSFPARYSLSALYHYLGIKEYYHGGLDYQTTLARLSGFKVLKMRDRILPFTLNNNFANPEIILKKLKNHAITQD